jgi:hypothetical protein
MIIPKLHPASPSSAVPENAGGGPGLGGSGGLHRSLSDSAGQVFCGNPRFTPPCDGSSQRLVTTFVRVKKCTPSGP